MSGTEHGGAAALNPNCDQRPARGGWAPGNYMALCSNCRQSFIGDKRAVMCADCAYIGTDRPDDERLVLALLELNSLRTELSALRQALATAEKELAETKSELEQVADDYQDLGREMHEELTKVEAERDSALESLRGMHGLLADALSIVRLRVPYTSSPAWEDVRTFIMHADDALTKNAAITATSGGTV